MTSDALDRLRDTNPVPVEPPVPPITSLLVRLDDGAPTAPRRRSRRLMLGIVAGATVAALIGVAIIGRPGDRGFDVAAAVYRATAPEGGVIHIVTESTKTDLTTGRVSRLGLVESWYDPGLNRMRSVRTNGSRVVEQALLGDRLETWTSTRPDVISRSTVPRVVGRPDDLIAELRASLRARRTRVIGRTRIHGREAWRIAVKVPGPVPKRFGGRRPPDGIWLVDAKTFVPLQLTGYASAVYKEGGPFVPISRSVTRYQTYERLAPTTANRALSRMSLRPGTRRIQGSP